MNYLTIPLVSLVDVTQIFIFISCRSTPPFAGCSDFHLVQTASAWVTLRGKYFVERLQKGFCPISKYLRSLVIGLLVGSAYLVLLKFAFHQILFVGDDTRLLNR